MINSNASATNGSGTATAGTQLDRDLAGIFARSPAAVTGNGSDEGSGKTFYIVAGLVALLFLVVVVNK